MTFAPMLAEKAPMAKMGDFASDDAYAFQDKFNGHRVMLRVEGGAITVTGRDGQVSQHTFAFRSPAHRDSFSRLAPHLLVLDAELVNGVAEIFDLVCMEGDTGTVVPSDPFSRRYEALVALFEAWSPPARLFRLAPTALGSEAKLTMALACLRNGGEGIMARRLDGRYASGQRTWAIVKLKVEHDADVVVMEVGREGKANIVLGAYPPGSDTLLEVGAASTYGKNLGPVAEGQVFTVRYNYMSTGSREDPNPHMVGPRIICRRTDKSAPECSTEQLAYQEVPVS